LSGNTPMRRLANLLVGSVLVLMFLSAVCTEIVQAVVRRVRRNR
jgi:hypothetical protein